MWKRHDLIQALWGHIWFLEFIITARVQVIYHHRKWVVSSETFNHNRPLEVRKISNCWNSLKIILVRWASGNIVSKTNFSEESNVYSHRRKEHKGKNTEKQKGRKAAFFKVRAEPWRSLDAVRQQGKPFAELNSPLHLASCLWERLHLDGRRQRNGVNNYSQ